MKNKDMPEKYGKALDMLKKNRYVLIVVLAGLFLLLLPTSGGGKQVESAPLSSMAEFSLAEQEARVSRALSKIEGAGAVTVVLTLKSSAEQVIAMNRDGSGRYTKGESGESDVQTSETAVIVSTGSGTQAPVTIKYIYPKYQGALVIAEGADSATVRLELLNAIAGLTGLGTDKITITKMKNS